MNIDEECDKLFKLGQKSILLELQELIKHERNREEDVLNQWIGRKLK